MSFHRNAKLGGASGRCQGSCGVGEGVPYSSSGLGRARSDAHLKLAANDLRVGARNASSCGMPASNFGLAISVEPGLIQTQQAAFVKGGTWQGDDSSGSRR